MKRAGMWALDHAVIFLCAGVIFGFSLLAPGFASLANLENLLVQSFSTAILAAGMTFVLLVAGVDLSVGSLMFLTAAIAYMLCGVCAVFGGILSLSQIGAVSPGFGLTREFGAIAAAVFGGTSLFGGRHPVTSARTIRPAFDFLELGIHGKIGASQGIGLSSRGSDRD